MPQVLTRLEGVVVTQARTNIRAGAPSIGARLSRQVEAGFEFPILGLAKGDRVAGQDDWYAGPNDEFVWAGAVRLRDGALVSTDGFRRADGTLKPLPVDHIGRIYGTFDYTEGRGGAIVPDPAWARTHLRKVHVPKGVDGDGFDFWAHVKAAPYFEQVFTQLGAMGLLERIITYDGAYVPRHMGWNPARALSSHSWGIAIDLNARWNAYGQEPTAMGALGSVRELVPMFEAAGFAWGGRFEPASLRDGMHFELARTEFTPAAAPVIATPVATPVAVATNSVAGLGSGLAFQVQEETVDGLRFWTYLDPIRGVRRKAGQSVAYALTHPITGAKVATRGLKRIGGFAGDPAPRYDAADWRVGFGYWADFVQATAEGESHRDFTCVNSYDRAAFTFGCFQFAAHTPERNLVRLLRRLLTDAKDEAAQYFPELALIDGKLSLIRGGQTTNLEGPQTRADGLDRRDAKGKPLEQGALMDFFNGSLTACEADEALAAARLITWATESGAHRQAQVAEGVWHADLLLRDTHERLAKTGGSLHGASFALCAMIFDIRHQGRTHPQHKTLTQGLAAALQTSNPMAMLMEFGAPTHNARIETVRQMIESGFATPSLAALRYDATLGAFA